MMVSSILAQAYILRAMQVRKSSSEVKDDHVLRQAVVENLAPNETDFMPALDLCLAYGLLKSSGPGTAAVDTVVHAELLRRFVFTSLTFTCKFSHFNNRPTDLFRAAI